MANDKPKPAASPKLAIVLPSRSMRDLSPAVAEWRREFPVVSKNAPYCGVVMAAAEKFEALLKQHPIAETIQVPSTIDGWRAVLNFCTVEGLARFVRTGDSRGLSDLGGIVAMALSSYDWRESRIADPDPADDETAKAAAVLRAQESPT